MKSQSPSIEQERVHQRPTLTARRLLNFLIAAGGHWVFQSMLYMDHSERRFKLALDLVLAIPLVLLFANWGSWPVSTLAGFVGAHTANFIFNAQLCALGANYSLVHVDEQRFFRYARALGRRAARAQAIDSAAVCGSLVQGSYSNESDLDVRLLRRPGLVNGIRAGWFVLRERSRALSTWFPLDIYLFDSDEALRGKLKPHETLTPLLHVVEEIEEANVRRHR